MAGMVETKTLPEVLEKIWAVEELIKSPKKDLIAAFNRLKSWAANRSMDLDDVIDYARKMLGIGTGTPVSVEFAKTEAEINRLYRQLAALPVNAPEAESILRRLRELQEEEARRMAEYFESHAAFTKAQADTLHQRVAELLSRYEDPPS